MADRGSLVGAPEGIRTPNLLIRSQMLYPLSYGRTAALCTASDTLACGPRRDEIDISSAPAPGAHPSTGVGR